MSTPEVDYEEGEELQPFVAGDKSESKDEENTSDVQSGEKFAEKVSTPRQENQVNQDDPWAGYSPESNGGNRTPPWKRTLAEKVPGCEPDRYPWESMLSRYVVERLDGKEGWGIVDWVGQFLEWRTIRKKRPVDKEERGPLMASWQSFSSKALSGGRKAVEDMLEGARKREKHDRQHSVTGIKTAIHDVCGKSKIACRVLLYENACNDCGFKAFDNPEFAKPTQFVKNEELAWKRRQYETILRDRMVDWRRNFEANIAAGRRVRLAKESRAAPKCPTQESSLSSARDNKSRESPFAVGVKRESRERESTRLDVGSYHQHQSPAAVVDEKSDFDFQMEEERDFALQEYDPDEKFRRFEERVQKKVAAFERTVATLESCVQTFATSLKQVTERCERIERELKNRVRGQDDVLKSQHLRIQALETWHQEQRRTAAKRSRDEAALASVGPVQTLRRRESLSAPSPATPDSSRG